MNEIEVDDLFSLNPLMDPILFLVRRIHHLQLHSEY